MPSTLTTKSSAGNSQSLTVLIAVGIGGEENVVRTGAGRAADEEISLSNRVQNHIDVQISNDSGYRFIKPRILGLPECSAL